MQHSLEFFLGLLDAREPAYVAHEDFEGEHGPVLRLSQQLGFVSREPGQNPVPSCNLCGEGVPYRIGERLVCDRCRSTVDPRHLLLWPLNREAFLRWLSEQWRLRGDIRQIEDGLWQLGTWGKSEATRECFYRRGRSFSQTARNRLSAFRQAVVFYGTSVPDAAEAERWPHLSLLELLQVGETLALADFAPLLRPRGNVRFDRETGALWAGEVLLGEVPPSSREFHLLNCLARQLDAFVSYQDLKAHVLRSAGSTDTTEEATFCQLLKSRIKKKWIPRIDRVLVSSNRGDGYRLRGYVEGV